MKWIKKRDAVIVGILLLIAGIVYFLYMQYAKDIPAKAEIYYQSELVKVVDLTKGTDEVFQIPQSDHVKFHLYPDGSIAFEESDCPDQICVRTGKIRIAGQSAACLPNGIIVKIVVAKENSDDDIDIIR